MKQFYRRTYKVNGLNVAFFQIGRKVKTLTVEVWEGDKFDDAGEKYTFPTLGVLTGRFDSNIISNRFEIHELDVVDVFKKYAVWYVNRNYDEGS